jgi:hypothetical protein
MNMTQLENIIKYITNSQGEKTEVIIPIDFWNSLLPAIIFDEIRTTDSGLSSIDEDEPKAQILADLQESIRAAKAGETYPISQLWDSIEN